MKDIFKDLSSLTNKERVTWKDFFIKLLSHSGFQLVFLFRISSFLRRNRLRFFSFLLDKIAYHLFHAEIRSTAKIGPGFVVNHTVGIVVGGKVVAGKNLSIRQNTTLGGSNNKRIGGDITQPVIGDNVTIGANCVIAGPIMIGDGSYISSMSFVNRNIPAEEVWGGVPARKIK